MAETVGVSRSAISRQSHRGERRAAPAIAGAALGQRRDSGDLHRRPTFRLRITSSARWAWTSKARSTSWASKPGATENAAAVKAPVNALAGSGLADGSQISVRHRWSQGVARGHRRSVRQRSAGAAVPQSQDATTSCDELPKEQQGQTRNLMRAAWKVKTAEEGEKRLEQIGALPGARLRIRGAQPARRHEGDVHLAAACRFRHRLHKCLATTNIIESPQSGVRTPHAQRDAAGAMPTWSSVGWRRPGCSPKSISAASMATRDLWASGRHPRPRDNSTTQPSTGESSVR